VWRSPAPTLLRCTLLVVPGNLRAQSVASIAQSLQRHMLPANRRRSTDKFEKKKPETRMFQRRPAKRKTRRADVRFSRCPLFCPSVSYGRRMRYPDAKAKCASRTAADCRTPRREPGERNPTARHVQKLAEFGRAGAEQSSDFFSHQIPWILGSRPAQPSEIPSTEAQAHAFCNREAIRGTGTRPVCH